MDDAKGEDGRLPCHGPVKSGASQKLFRRGARLCPYPFGAPLRGRADPRPTAELRLDTHVPLAMSASARHSPPQQAARRLLPC